MNNKGAYKKKARNLNNVIARRDLLVSCIECPDDVSPILAKCLKSQRAFASLHLGETIYPLSKNTIETLANELFSANGENGYKYFDSLRLNLLKIQQKKNGKKSLSAKNTALNESVHEMATTIKLLQMDNIQNNKAYLDLFSSINELVKEATLAETTKLRLINMLNDHRVKFKDLFAPHQAKNSNRKGQVLKLVRSNENPDA